ncbi:hypothetical protein LWI28_025301 [Acer negundo]|uniref:Uncharacterized protein n=1 Tax=Acer negundo TaxID=4023 RepID=A0AAD5IW12_ACENE|nr:hypothetical protein LWI28_025301 [Acer negundo]
MLPATILPDALLVYSSSSSVSHTINVGISLGSSWLTGLKQVFQLSFPLCLRHALLGEPTPPTIGQASGVVTSTAELPIQKDDKKQEVEDLAEAMIELVE